MAPQVVAALASAERRPAGELLAAAAAELALELGRSWPFDVGDPPVASERMIARATRDGANGGPHCRRLLDALST